LTIADVRSTLKNFPRITTLLATMALLSSAATVVSAQTERSPAILTNSTDAMLSLPDAPSFTTSSSAALDDTASSSVTSDISSPSDADAAATETTEHRLLFAARRDITVQPGQVAPPLSISGKVTLGLKESFTLFSVAGWVTSAGYSQLTNGSPNYGTDSGAFGMRLGATAIRNISENVFGNAVFAPIFRDDPRYYKMGNGHNVVKRVLYATTRTLITKADDGRARPNYSLISGNLAGAVLTNAYYPRLNHGFDETAKTFGTSMGGSAFGFIVTEFLDDALRIAHLQRLE
jgi:hypothetical protein